MSKQITTGMLSGVTINGISINTSMPCNTGNYTNCSSRSVAYVVMHYTGNAKDTASGNCNYFRASGRSASAHLFVDETSIYQSVELRDRAWHCGTSGKYYHSVCRNTNSIGIEMCTSGSCKISDKTKENAAQTCAYICKLLGITAAQVDTYVLRHWDVTHKDCPAQMAGSSNSEWTDFKDRVKTILDGSAITLLSKVVQVVADDGTLNVRSGAGTSYSILGTLANGQTAEVVGSSGNWYKIKYGGDYGYISSAYTADVASTTKNISNQEDDEVIEATKHKINGKTRTINAITKDGVTYTCLRDLCTALGLDLAWNSSTGERVITLPDVEVKVNGQAITVPGAFVNADTHLAAVGNLLQGMGYNVGCTSAYHVTADTSETN